MWRLRRRDGGAAVADLPAMSAAELSASVEQLRAEIAETAAANRSGADRSLERRLLVLRHLAASRLIDSTGEEPRFPEPDFDRLPEGDPLPELRPQDLTPGVLRAGILRDGCVLVRGLVPRENALALAAAIDEAYEQRELLDARQPAADGYYEEFHPHERFGEIPGRDWIKQGGGLLAADSPRLSFRMTELFEQAGVPALASGYLGEPALISAEKTTLRKADPTVGGAWHQDGYFMGDVRSLNLWLSLSRCGDVAPGLDIVPRRLDYLVTTQTEEAMLDYTISQTKAEEAARDTPIVRPVFEPGDAMFFDDLFLHKTGSDPSMPDPRFAIENWFFGPSGFPSEYAPLLV
jgi:hypothetical protein